MKTFKYTFGIIIILLISLFSYQYYQKMKFKNYVPKVESIVKINIFLRKNPHIEKSTVLIPKNYESCLALQNYYGAGSAYVFDKNFKIIDNNISNENGSCFSDISKFICNDFKNPNPKLTAKSKDRLKLLLDNAIKLDKNNIDLKNYKFIVVYSWCIYLPPSYDKELLSFLKCINPNEVLVLSLNLDNLDSWK